MLLEASPSSPSQHPTLASKGSQPDPMATSGLPSSLATRSGASHLVAPLPNFPCPHPTATPNGITAGPDGNLWFTESDKIGRITPGGTITVFALPTANSQPFGIAAGPDGNLWFTESDKIGRITPGGTITEFPMPTARSRPEGITAGPDGNLWFIEFFANKIGRIMTGK